MMPGITAGKVPAPSWTPAALFDGSTTGVWLDPSDLSTVWQDAAGTVPGAVGQPVGLLQDKSGNACDAYQPTSGNRPILRTSGGKYWLEHTGAQWMYLGDTAAKTDYERAVIAVRSRQQLDQVVIVGKPHAAAHSAPYFRWVLYYEMARATTRINGAEVVMPASSWPLTTLGTCVLDSPAGALRLGGLSTAFAPQDFAYPNSVQARIGANVAAGEVFYGSIFSLVIAARALSGGEMAALTDYLGRQS